MNYPRIAVALVCVLASNLSYAWADCKAHPRNEWMKEAQARAKLEKEGYKIKSFKASGDCYELYGFDKQGGQVEIYFDAKTLAVVKRAE